MSDVPCLPAPTSAPILPPNDTHNDHNAHSAPRSSQCNLVAEAVNEKHEAIACHQPLTLPPSHERLTTLNARNEAANATGHRRSNNADREYIVETHKTPSPHSMLPTNPFNILENQPGEDDRTDEQMSEQDVDMEDVTDEDTPPAKQEQYIGDVEVDWQSVKGKKASKARTATQADLEEKSASKAKTQRFAYDAYADFKARKNAAKKRAVASDVESEDEPEDDSGDDSDAATTKGGTGFMGDARRQTFQGAKNSGDAQAKAFFAQTGMPLPPDTSASAPPRNSNKSGAAGSSSSAGGTNKADNANAGKQGQTPGGAPPPPPAGQPTGAANAQPNSGASVPPPARTVGNPPPYPYKPKVGRRAAHEQQPRDAFGFSIWPREVRLSGLPSAKALKANLEPVQRNAFDAADPDTCVFVYVECADHTDIPAAVSRFALENYGKGRFPGNPPIPVITANPNPRFGKNYRSRTILIRGTREQIKAIIEEVAISTSLGCFIARPINAGPPTFLCTWANLTFSADQAGEVLVLAINAARACKELRAALELPINDLIPADVNPVDCFVDSIHVEPFAINEPGTQINAIWWQIHGLVPTSDTEAHARFRRVFAKNVSVVTAYDGYSSTPEKPFKCSICRSIEHPQGLCPLPKQPEWYGFVPRERGFIDPEEVKDEDEPKLAEAEEPAPKEPGPSQLPKPTMSKNFGDKGGKGKGKGKGYGKK
ncbi:hypothetical protein EXIGLDRAFT_774420 [Exidia glandulosa HHB12029]|uniref:Uncharacterized protein n=1 Tax=Exidia glandulosa HHB12029 TaxID=1314781 RepID=A0A165EDC3_EXIGL|nr:hypothetical protein EXIGLDRAFT_774420 [Exidia glandulosa HHB12029]